MKPFSTFSISVIPLVLQTVLSLSVVQAADNAADIHIIPQPAQLQRLEGVFPLRHQTKIYFQGSNKIRTIANALANYLRPATGLPLPVHHIDKAPPPANTILLTLNAADKALAPEGYELSVTSNAIVLRAPAPAGLFHGLQSIRQLLPPQIENPRYVPDIDWSIPCVKITDRPRYAWRGMHLDSCRHFMSTNVVKQFIDFIAFYKMNVFHWHLTEDQGWRIEIKKYPRLTEISAWRRGDDGQPYGGYYTQEDIRDIVAYARARHITVVPEIEMPGHAIAVLAAYPEFSCSGGPFEVRTTWGISEDVFCAGNDATFGFLEDVLSEVINLFPGVYVHIGGDECPKVRWKKCGQCQARIVAEGLQDEHELQSYFIKRVEKFLTANNRRLIGWDEILEGGLAPQATVMSWRGEEGGIAAAGQNHDVVMSPGPFCYFDMKQRDDPDERGHTWAGVVTLEKVYSYEPTPAQLTPQQARHILGAQANVWTEYIPTGNEVEYMTLPRMCALAEVVWSPKDRRDWSHFNQRLQDQYRRFDILGVNYYKGNKTP